MRCPNLEELPSPPPGKTGWPWTLASAPASPANLPRITVVTPSLNQGQFLEETIRSVLLQGYPDIEYMIVDAGSTDASLTIIRKYEPWLAFWVSEPDRGQADGINKGWQRATGDIVAYLNADDTYCSDVFATVGAADFTGLLYGNCHVIDEQSVRVRHRITRQATLADVLAWSPSIPQPAMFLRRVALEAVGPLETSLHYTMDYEITVRLMEEYPAKFIPQFLANMRGHPAAKTARRPTEHVLEGIRVAETFFANTTDERLAKRENFTLAALHLRLARVYAWQNHRHHARAQLRSALCRSWHPVTLGRAAAVLTMCIVSHFMPRLRQWKHRFLKWKVAP